MIRVIPAIRAIRATRAIRAIKANREIRTLGQSGQRGTLGTHINQGNQENWANHCNQCNQGNKGNLKYHDFFNHQYYLIYHQSLMYLYSYCFWQGLHEFLAWLFSLFLAFSAIEFEPSFFLPILNQD